MKPLRFFLPLAAVILSFSANSQCVLDSDCDDGIACTQDICNAPICANTPSNALCDDGIPCTADVCSNFQCVHTPNNSLCSDPDPCNGAETCNALLGCQPGTPPSVVASLSITSSPPMPVCTSSGQAVTFTAAPVNGGSSPIYQWFKNGTVVGTNSNTYANAALVSGDQIWCEMTSNATCVTSSPASSNIINVALFNYNVGATVSVTPESSCSNFSGSAEANVSGGIPPYTYGWSNGGSTQTISSLCTGNFTVTTTDLNGCTATATGVVTKLATLTGTVSKISPDCHGNLGSISVTPVGGEPPYTFSWRGGSTSQTNTNLLGGSYDVTITDARMCTRWLCIFLLPPGVITANVSVTRPKCNGDSNGSINLSAVGGAPPFTYSWSNSATTEDITNLPAGNYTVTVTDTSGCSTTTSTNLSQPDVFTGTVSTRDLSCFGMDDGTAMLHLTGGTYPYTVTWSNGVTSGSWGYHIGNLSAGTYCATATDVNNCSFNICGTINQPPQSIFLGISATPPQIQTGQSSNLSVTGCSGCTYSWSPPNGLNSSAVQNPVATPVGTTNYVVTATDANGCTATADVLVTVGSGLIISGIIKTETGVFIPGVSVALTGTISSSNTTASYPSNGQYSFATTTGNYTVTPSKNNDILVTNGASTLDILLMRSHVLSNQLLNTPYKIIAADVNASGSVSTADILLVRSLVLNNIQSFPGGNLWTFVSSDFVISNPLTPFPYDNFRSYANLTSSKTGEDFIGVKLGDVNNNWNPATPKTSAVGDVLFSMEDYQALPGDEVIVPVKVKSFESIKGYQFTLSWDASVLSLLEVNNKALEGYYGVRSVAAGYLTTLWYDEMVKAVTLDDDAEAFELKFKVIGANGSFSPITISSELTASEAYNDTLDLLNIVPTNGMVKVRDSHSLNTQHSALITLYVQPNPFTNTTRIIFTLPQDETVSLSIYDVLGREVKQLKAAYQAGEHQIEWSGDEQGIPLGKGLYHVRMVAGGNTLGTKIVMMR